MLDGLARQALPSCSTSLGCAWRLYHRSEGCPMFTEPVFGNKNGYQLDGSTGVQTVGRLCAGKHWWIVRWTEGSHKSSLYTSVLLLSFHLVSS